jgi:hypothetical protein
MDGHPVLIPPKPAILDGPGDVRWAAGSATGMRSNTWRVRGVSNNAGRDDIYIGTRRSMNIVKIDLHDANADRGWEPATILRVNPKFAANIAIDSPYLNLGRAAPVAHGWRHELTIATPTTTFGSFTETPRLKSGEEIAWWPAPPTPEHLSFHLYVGDPERADLTISNHIGDVCQMPFANGRCLWIVAQSEPMDDSVETAIREHVASLPTGPGRIVHPFTLRKMPGRVPVLLDLAITDSRGVAE